ncbi:MAG: thioredoxin domain-containing protein [Ardenticatenaceae bacterium]|nr:thioredoxin domain-containing protein [Ardenticatenaceae bacterium]MCB9446134.1 thioredoxin domain-containing protein [Ardenticatenaceae bacterium]
MLGTEPEIAANFIETGQVKAVFWPILNHGSPSVYSTITAVCVGQQDAKAFWDVHERLFENQEDLWDADRDYYVQTAVAAGVDQATFEACYDDPDTLSQVQKLDEIRRQWGVYSQPTFDVNGRTFSGAQPYDVFEEVLQAALSE